MSAVGQSRHSRHPGVSVRPKSGHSANDLLPSGRNRTPVDVSKVPVGGHQRPAESPRGLWNIGPGLLRFDIGGPDHLAPLLGLVGNEFFEFGRCHQHWVNAEAGKPRLCRWIGRDGVDLFVELVDYLGGRIPRRADAVPRTRLVTRHEFGHSRDVWQHIQRVAVVTASARSMPDLMY